MNKVLLLKFGELFLKGKNRREFMKLLMNNIRKKLASYQFKLVETQGRLILCDYNLDQEDEIVEKIQHVFGLIGVAVAVEFDTTLENIEDEIKKVDLGSAKTFKVEVKRADKTFEMNSMQLEKHLGGVVLDAYPEMKVDLYHPEVVLNVELRVNQKTYIYSNLL